MDITPGAFPIIISGGFIAARADRAAGTLHARALALDDGKMRLVISVVDTLMMPRELVDRIREAAARRTGVPAAHMLISATHTHSAPPVMGALGTDANPEYAKVLETGAVEAIERAVRNLQPARIGFGQADLPDLTHCRRWILRPDRIRKDPFGSDTVRAHMHPGYQNPDFVGPSGPTDPQLSVVAVQLAEGRPLALLANYSMHYVGVPGGVVSPDYYGPFAENIERLMGGGVAMMSQGTSGDLHWMDYSRPKAGTTPEEYAERMAASAHEVYRRIEYRKWVPLAAAEKKLRLSRRVAEPERLAWAKQIVAAMGDRLPKDIAEVYAREQVLIAAEPQRDLRLMAVRIGDWGIAAIPNEVFAITGLKIKAGSPLPATFNVELANGADGYIPPPEQHKLGGYTTWAARTAGLEIEAEPRIVDTILGLLEQVAGKPRRVRQEPDGSYAKAVLASKPLAYWRGGEFGGAVAQDRSGNGNHGSYDAGVAPYLDGPVSEAFSGREVNRTPQYAGGRMRAEVPGLKGRYTVELWFYNGLPPDAREVTGHMFSTGPDRLGIGGSSGAQGKLFFRSGEARLEGRTPLEIRTWNHVVVSREGGSVRVYLNGKAEPEISGAVPPASGAGRFTIGGCADGSESFEGRLDEVAVYGRALPAKAAVLHFQTARMRRSP